MGLIIGGVPPHDLILDGQSVSLYEGGNPPVKLWPTGETGETVQITLGTEYEARDQLRTALTERGRNYQTITRVPFDIELVGTGSLQQLFYDCSALTEVPNMDTSQVTNMSRMFYGCSALTEVPNMDTSQVTEMATMFRGCKALTHLPDLDTSNVTDMSSMFNGCLSLTEVPDLDTSNVTAMNSMFYTCPSLTEVPNMDTSQVTNMISMFNGCSALTYVPDLDTSQVTNMTFTFRSCSALTDGNVRLIGRHPNVTITSMILDSGLTREPFYDTDGNPI